MNTTIPPATVAPWDALPTTTPAALADPAPDDGTHALIGGELVEPPADLRPAAKQPPQTGLHRPLFAPRPAAGEPSPGNGASAAEDGARQKRKPGRPGKASEPMLFNFDGLPVRSMKIKGEPWFVAADVCAVLEIANSRDAMSRLSDDEKGVGTTDTLGGSQLVGIVNESGLYALVFNSRKPDAQRFRRWVTGEVLPSIRKTGGYRLDDHNRRVRDVFNTAGASTKAQGLRGAARLEGVRAAVSAIAPDLLHLVVTPAPAPVAPTPAPAADLLGDHARRVREVFQLVEQTANARGLRGKARDEVARAVVQEIAPDLLHLVAMPAPAAPVTPPPAPVADLPTLFGKPKEGADLLLNVADWFRKNAKTGFLLWALDEFNPKNAGRVAGWVRPTASGSEVFYILVDAFRHEACKGIDYRAALRALEAEGLTIREGQPPRRGEPDARRFDAKARPPLYAPGSARVYRIKGEVLNLTA
ncbi:BRO-N domain-containing protein [Sphaerotilus sp.]|uniref:BRO-N domain-containing protein n=1 Tax=Sphaerotilus sp. TaxID=2093942 RepID=UPI0025DCFCBB|nr:Bro-N domain-containing protein [Sphaerotilus sp.]